MNIPRDVSTPLSATPNTRDGTGVTGSIRETGSYPGIEGAVGGAAGAAYGAFFDGVPNLFRHLASVYAGTVHSRARCIAPATAATVWVTKKDGSTKFCVDYRKVNEVTRKYTYPLPWIDNTLDALQGSQYFNTLDLYSGYWQVKKDPKDIDKTAFVTRQRLFHFMVMPFGLWKELATFEKLMELVLSGFNWKICLIYLDDVLVYGGNFCDALDRLKTVWQRIREANLKLKPSKCCLWQRIREANLKLKPSKCCLMHDWVPFLGHYISCDGLQVDPMKTATVHDWLTPHIVKDDEGLLGVGVVLSA